MDQPGALGATTGVRVARPHTWLWPSLLAAIFLFLPLGLVAVIYALRAQSAQAAGDDTAFRAAATIARRWLLAAVVIGVLLDLLLISALFLLGAGG